MARDRGAIYHLVMMEAVSDRSVSYPVNHLSGMAIDGGKIQPPRVPNVYQLTMDYTSTSVYA